MNHKHSNHLQPPLPSGILCLHPLTPCFPSPCSVSPAMLRSCRAQPYKVSWSTCRSLPTGLIQLAGAFCAAYEQTNTNVKTFRRRHLLSRFTTGPAILYCLTLLFPVCVVSAQPLEVCELVDRHGLAKGPTEYLLVNQQTLKPPLNVTHLFLKAFSFFYFSVLSPWKPEACMAGRKCFSSLPGHPPHQRRVCTTSED